MVDFTFIDLFCGLGGFRIALQNMGGTCVFSSDKNKHARQTYFDNFGEMPQGDITKIDAKDIPPFQVLCAGFPCQPYSMAGKRKGLEDPRGQLFYEIVRIASYHKPEVLFLENVAALATHDNGKTLAIIVKALEDIGYNVHYKTLLASDYDTAQIRKRLYFVCFRKDLEVSFTFPRVLGNCSCVEDYLEPEVDEHYFIDASLVTFYKPDLIVPINDTYLMGYIGSTGQSRRVYSSKGITPTFVCQSRGPAGSTESYYINGRVRRLTPLEAQRIMGFPDSYKLPETERVAYELLGNSVAIKVLEEIAYQIYDTGIFA